MQDNRAYTGEKGTGVLNGYKSNTDWRQAVKDGVLAQSALKTGRANGAPAQIKAGDILRTSAPALPGDAINTENAKGVSPAHPLWQTALELASRNQSSRNQANGQSGTVPPWSQGYGTQAAQGAAGPVTAIGSLGSSDMAIIMLNKLTDSAAPDGAQLSPHRIYNAYLEMLDELDAARKSGMTAREYAQSKGVPSSLSDEDAAILDEYEMRMRMKDMGEEADKANADGDKKTKFTYKNNPMNNSSASKDIVKNQNAVYGYSPNPQSERIGEYADYDWTNPELVELAKARRETYHIKNANIRSLIDLMRAKSASAEEIARAANELRNQNRLNDYINDPVGLEKVKRRNLKVYGNANGLTAEEAYKKYGSWEKVIESALNSNPGMDACCGLYDKYYLGG